MPIHLDIACNCFHATVTELSSCDRQSGLQILVFTSQSFTEVCQPCIRLLRRIIISRMRWGPSSSSCCFCMFLVAHLWYVWFLFPAPALLVLLLLCGCTKQQRPHISSVYEQGPGCALSSGKAREGEDNLRDCTVAVKDQVRNILWSLNSQNLDWVCVDGEGKG